MNRLPSSLGIVVFLVAAVPAWAQQNPIATIKVRGETTSVVSKTPVAPKTLPAPRTQNQSQTLSPSEMVIQRATARADQRRQRLAAMKQRGQSISRPQIGTDVTSW